MIIQSKALVLASQPYLGKKFFVDAYTSTGGRERFIWLKPSKIGLPLPFSVCDLVIEHKESRNIQVITAIRSSFSYASGNPVKATVSIFLSEVCLQVFQESTPDDTLFDFLESVASALNRQGTLEEHFHLTFLMKLTRFVGLLPHGDYSQTTPFFDMQEGKFSARPPVNPFYLEETNAQLFNLLMQHCFSQAGPPLHLSTAQRRNLTQILIDYFRLHLSGMKEIKSHTVLQEL